MTPGTRTAVSLATLAVLLLAITVAARVSGDGAANAHEDLARVPDLAEVTAPYQAVGPASDGGPDAARGRVSDGQLELHGLTAWEADEGESWVYLSFAPISVEDLLGGAPFRRTIMGGEEIEVADVAPELDPSHVAVLLDDIPASVSAVSWYYAGYGDLSGSDTKYMPVCVIRVERPQLSDGEHRVSVEIEDASTGAVGRSETTLDATAARERL